MEAIILLPTADFHEGSVTKATDDILKIVIIRSYT
jgi:hypothetical protein